MAKRTRQRHAGQPQRRGKSARQATPTPEEPRNESSIQPVLNSDPPIVESEAKVNEQDGDVWVEGHKIQIYDLSDDFKFQRGKRTAQGQGAASSNGVVEKEYGVDNEAKDPENMVKSDMPETKAPEPKASEKKTPETSEQDSKDLLSAAMAQVKHIGTGPVLHDVNDTIVAYIVVNGFKIKLSLEVVETVNANANMQEKVKLTKSDKATVPKETVKAMPKETVKVLPKELKETKDITPKEKTDSKLKEKKTITSIAISDPSPKSPGNIEPSKDLIPYSARSTGMVEDIYAHESLSSEAHTSEPLSLIIFTGDEQRPKRPQDAPNSALRLAPPLGSKPFARKPCTYVNTLRGCNYGASCLNSHDLQGVVCGKGRTRASCPNGYRCFYLHGADDRPQEKQREAPRPRQPGQMGPPAVPRALGESQTAGKKRGLEESHEGPRGKKAREEGPGS